MFVQSLTVPVHSILTLVNPFLILIDSSLLNDTEKKMDDLQLNKCFDISIEDNKIDIADYQCLYNL